MNTKTGWTMLAIMYGALAVPQIGTPPTALELPQDGIEVLDHYSGVWDSQFTIKPLSSSDEPKSFSGVVEAGRVVGDKFLEQTGTYQTGGSAGPMVIKTMMSYDQGQQVYRYDYYISSGEIRHSTGRWDNDARTMTSTFTGYDDGKLTTIVADFSQPDLERWTIETRDRKGNTIMKIEGTNTRRTGDWD